MATAHYKRDTTPPIYTTSWLSRSKRWPATMRPTGLTERRWEQAILEHYRFTTLSKTVKKPEKQKLNAWQKKKSEKRNNPLLYNTTPRADSTAMSALAVFCALRTELQKPGSSQIIDWLELKPHLARAKVFKPTFEEILRK